MERRSHTSKGEKQAVTCRISTELLRQARAAGLNVSRVLEEALEQRLEGEPVVRWEAEQAADVEEYHREIAREGIFGSRPRGS